MQGRAAQMLYRDETDTGLPDPQYEAAFYADVPLKRFLAFVVDTLLILLISALIVPFTGFLALFFFGLLAWVVGLVYRAASLARGGATPGMRLMGLELRDWQGRRPDPVLAILHTAFFMIAFTLMMPQVISVLLMLTTPRRQGLHDLFLGTAVINRPAEES